MALYGLLLAGLLVFVYSALKKKLRRQARELDRSTTRLDEFTAENERLQRRSDRDAEQSGRSG